MSGDEPPSLPSAYRILRDGLTEGRWHPSEYPWGSPAAARWYASITTEVFEVLAKAGYTLIKPETHHEGVWAMGDVGGAGECVCQCPKCWDGQDCRCLDCQRPTCKHPSGNGASRLPKVCMIPDCGCVGDAHP